MSKLILIKSKYILPMTPAMKIIEDGMIVIEGEKIKAIGKEKDLEKEYKNGEVIDAGNSIALPGLINTHTHAAMTYFRGLADDLPLNEWLEKHIWPAEGKFVNPEFVKNATELAALEMIKSGTTCFNDMYFFEDIVGEIAEKMGMRAVLGETVINFPTPSAATPHLAFEETKKLIDKFKDNELISVAVAPHSIYICDKELLLASKELADKYNLPIHIHISETKKEVDDSQAERKLSPVEYLDKIGFLSDKVIAAHSVWLTDADLKIYKKRGVKVSHNPISNMKLASGIMPAAKMINAGITVALGTDGAASNNTLDLFSDMRIAALLHKVNDMEPTVASAKEVVQMATINGAKALGLDKKIGSLEVGKKADIITINLDQPHLVPIYDPYSHLVYSANQSDVANVIINGKIIMRDREVIGVDEKEIINKAKNFIKN